MKTLLILTIFFNLISCAKTVYKEIDYTDKTNRVYQEDNNIYLHTKNSIKKITHDDGKYYAPKLSPDKEHILFELLSKGLMLYDVASNKTQNISDGDSGSWHPSSRYILYGKVMEDDGYNVTKAEIFVYDLKSDKELQISDTPNIVEEDVRFLKDGKFVVYRDQDNGKVYRVKFKAKINKTIK